MYADVRPSQPVAPGQPERVDCEYERRGTANLFFLVEPVRGWRQVTVTTQRTKQDYAQQLRWLVDVAHPQADYVRVVQGNLNTHTPGPLYEAFPPEEARRILRRLEFHYMPKHASWLNMAEIGIGVFQRSCLQRRLVYAFLHHPMEITPILLVLPHQTTSAAGHAWVAEVLGLVAVGCVLLTTVWEATPQNFPLDFLIFSNAASSQS